MHAIVVYIPQSHLEAVKTAMFQAGGGRIGNYDCCAWSVLGEGQFRALEGANPFLGELGKIETVAEYRVEMVCESGVVKKVLDAMKATHPYETPAFLVFESVIQ
jgi:hypothetical protein